MCHTHACVCAHTTHEQAHAHPRTAQPHGLVHVEQTWPGLDGHGRKGHPRVEDGPREGDREARWRVSGQQGQAEAEDSDACSHLEGTFALDCQWTEESTPRTPGPATRPQSRGPAPGPSSCWGHTVLTSRPLLMPPLWVTSEGGTLPGEIPAGMVVYAVCLVPRTVWNPGPAGRGRRPAFLLSSKVETLQLCYRDPGDPRSPGLGACAQPSALSLNQGHRTWGQEPENPDSENLVCPSVCLLLWLFSFLI